MTQTVSRPVLEEAAAPSRPRSALSRLTASDRFWGWCGPLLVMAIGGFQRFWNLGRPHKLVFDEAFYVKEAASYLRYGYEMAGDPIPSGSPDPFTQGATDVWGDTPAMVVHPPVGKWMIAFGEWIFGPASSFGWRFSCALVGTLSILIIGRAARRLFGSTLLGTTAALLLAVDGQHFAHSRTGILDIFVMFWALAAFACLLVDRDQARTRLTRLLAARPPGAPPPRFGPWLGLRPWRIAGIVSLALCTGVKWSGLYFTAAFLLMSVLWDAANRRAHGVRIWLPGAVLADGVQAFVTTVVLLPALYLASWVGWFAGSNGFGRQWAATHAAAPGWGWVPDPVRSLLHYHSDMWVFHVNLHTTHPYMSNPWSWLVLGRPTAFFYERVPQGTAGCRVADCAQAITPLGNPVVWWGGTIAIAVLAFRWALGRDWRAGAILSGIAAGYLPWFLYQERTIFAFYSVAFVPWMVLAVTYVLGLLIGPRGQSEDRRRSGAVAAGGIVFVAVLLFWFFYPVLAGEVIPSGSWGLRMWFRSWI